MTFGLVFEQLLNGLQYGVTLFLMAAGLTLVFGIMNFINLAHGSLYMVGAYLTVAATNWTGSYVAGVALGLAGTLVVGMLVEVIALRTLYDRDHLDQVLATFGLILFFNELVAIIWGRASLFASPPSWLAGHVELFTGSRYPLYRLVILGVGLVVRRRALVRGHPHPPGHADPRRRDQSHHGGGARHQHPPALHRGLRLRRGARRLAGLLAGRSTTCSRAWANWC
jgi:ABC-type branched-subunit amino acid transport system permease subunit